MSNVLFCHGLESAPHGRKYHALKEAGLDVRAPDFQGLNLAARVAKLLPILDSDLFVAGIWHGIQLFRAHGVVQACPQIVIPRDQRQCRRDPKPCRPTNPYWVNWSCLVLDERQGLSI